MEHSVFSDFELQERKVARLKRERERRAMEDEVLQDVRTSLPTTPRKLDSSLSIYTCLQLSKHYVGL